MTYNVFSGTLNPTHFTSRVQKWWDEIGKTAIIQTVQRRHGASADLTREYLKHFSVSRALVSLDCGIWEL